VGTGAAQNRAARLPSLLARSNTHPLVDGVLAFTKGTAQGDDMTLVVVGVKHEAGI
jgi:serine phosphatase RsbU (regulator of sigma subunit)